MRRHLARLALGTVVLLIAGPAAATHGGIHPTFRTEEVFFHCPGPTKVQNVNNAGVLGVGLDNPAPWDTNPPEQSAQEGAGCGALDLGVLRNGGAVDGYFRGTFTGNLRDLTIRIHNLLLSQIRQTDNLTVKISELIIDGETYVDNQTAEVEPVLSDTGLTEFVELSVVGLGSATEITDADGNVVDVQTEGLATEDGDGEIEREITIFLDTDPNTVQSAWVWDTTEVPSGIVFNPEEPAAAQIQAFPPF